MPFILKHLRNLAIAYVLLLVMLTLFQRDLLYHPNTKQLPPAHYNVAMEEISLTTADGTSLLSWYKKAENGKPTIVYFHGNAGNLGHRHKKFNLMLERGYGVLALSYRGFGLSKGSPTEEGLYQDARAALNYLHDHGIAENNIILYGESLGTGVAVQMATEIHPRAIMLEAPYTSIADVAQDIYWYAPVSLMLWDRFDSLSKIKQVTAPLVLMHGERDRVVPFHYGKQLFDAANSPKRNLFDPALDHEGHDVAKALTLMEELLANPAQKVHKAP